jgi:hypothetical protein
VAYIGCRRSTGAPSLRTQSKKVRLWWRWYPQVHLVWYFPPQKKRTCQVRLCISRCTWGSPDRSADPVQVHLGISRCTHVVVVAIGGAPGLSTRRTWAKKKKRACRSAHGAWFPSNYQPYPQAHMW